MAGEISFFEIPAKDGDAARAFYGQLFGWTFADGNFPGYWMIDGGGTAAGLASGDDSATPRVFFTVGDIDDGVAHVRELGGQADDPTTIPSGRFARCRDDQGVPFSLWQDA